MALPYENIQNVAMGVDLSRQTVENLRRMTKLRELLLLLQFSRQLPFSTESDILLPRLYRLGLAFETLLIEEPGQFVGFLDRLKAPLTILELSFASIMQFPELDTTTTKSLTTLIVAGDMGGHQSNTRYLLQFLSRVPTVTFLKVIDKSITTEFVVALTVVSNREPLLPLLRSLDISGCRDYPDMMPTKYFWDMLESRLPRAGGIAAPCAKSCAVLEEISVPRWLYDCDDERWRAIRADNVKVRPAAGVMDKAGGKST
ncbi:hypothetical protein BDZ89DRAFT_1051501 [Hymenopellis radicata]|nr:hypothetical protein BDZ89DRAFT_1051501 [Hymenopellis radicata]